jgi:hypothetical protein
MSQNAALHCANKLLRFHIGRKINTANYRVQISRRFLGFLNVCKFGFRIYFSYKQQTKVAHVTTFWILVRHSTARDNDMFHVGARISYKPDAVEGDICDGNCVSKDCATAPSKFITIC